MLIVDRALRTRQEQGRPIRLGIVGAGAMGRAIAMQINRVTPGMEVVGIANRRVDRAEDAYRAAGHDRVVTVDDADGLAHALDEGVPAVTDDPGLLCAAEGIDAILEVTGAPEFGARVVLATIAGGKHAITMNAELQGTVGPILKVKADAAGVLLTDSDGDQPGVLMNLHRFVTGLGVTPVLAGNMKGLHDPYRNPTTQEDFARRHHLTPHMAASFADGTKMSFEMALVANATGMRAGTLGLHGPHVGHVTEAKDHYPPEELAAPGIVDYVVGSEPAPGVFVLGTHDDPEQMRWLQLYKLGDGPIYTFYTPYHLCHLEAPTTVARVVDFHDAAITPEAGHVVDVVATAKRDLRPGQTIDGIGWYDTYGQCANADETVRERLLPMGLAEGCIVVRPVAKDALLTRDDVELPGDRVIERLWREQAALDTAPAAAPI